MKFFEKLDAWTYRTRPVKTKKDAWLMFIRIYMLMAPMAIAGGFLAAKYRPWIFEDRPFMMFYAVTCSMIMGTILRYLSDKKYYSEKNT